jgi:hypothetical protein
MSNQYDPTKVGQQGEILGGVHTSAVLAKLYSNIPAGSTAYTSDLGPVTFTGAAWIANAASGLPAGGTVGQVATNTGPGTGDWETVPDLVADPNGTTTIVTPAANQIAVSAAIPQSLWAARSSGVFIGQTILITDIGPPGGSIFRWDGTVWRVTAPTDVIYDITLQTAAALNTSEQIIKQNTIPVGLISACRLMVIRILWAKDGTTDAATAVKLYIGSAGTTGDTLVQASGSMSAASRAYATEAWLIPTTTTNLRNASANVIAGFSNNSNTSITPQNFAVADYTANPLILTCSVTMAGSTNHGQVAHMFVELRP